MPIIEQFFIKLTKAAQPPEMFHKKGVHKNSTIFTGQESPVLKSCLGQGWNKCSTDVFLWILNFLVSFEEHLQTATSENY